MAFRFVHTADLHLDSPLRSLALRDPALAGLIGTATRTALERIVALCLAERVDALLVAGDLYDGAQTSMKTARHLAERLAQLTAAGVTVVLIRGNHDAQARITGALELPEGVHVFGTRPDTLRLEGGGVAVAIHGVSFAARSPDHPLRRFPAALPGAVNIGMLHTSLGGAAGHDPYAPVSPGELAALDYDYWALGHLHARQVIAGRPLIVMPGMPQGRDIGEAGSKSVSLVTLRPGAPPEVEARPVALAEFARLPVDLSAAAGWEDVTPRIAAALEGARAEAGAEHLVLRLDLTGATPLAWRLRRDLDLVAEEATAHARGLGGLWIEAVETACTPPADPAQATDDSGGALDELARLLAAPPSPALDAALAALYDEIARALPAELRPRFPADPAPAAALRAELAHEGVADVLARLRGADG